MLHAEDRPKTVPDSSDVHPHRGMAKLTYVLNGEADHYDNRGNHAHVNSGGAQWMKAGKGIIHNEAVNPAPATDDRLTHSLQFWVNLPAKNRSEEPEYLPLQADDIPLSELPDSSGWLKVVASSYENLTSPIPSYQEQLLYHIHLLPLATFELDTNAQWEYALFLPDTGTALINEEYYSSRQLHFGHNSR